MAGRRDWTGTLEELYEKLSNVQVGTFFARSGWPNGPEAFAANLRNLEPKLADADLLVDRIGNGRLLIHRRSSEYAPGESSSSQ